MGVRIFWKNTPDWIKDAGWLKAAYAQGVPMGADMPVMPAGATAPSFAVWAVKDADFGQSRPDPDRQGLDEERSELREGVRRRMGRRPRASEVDRRRAADRQHGRHRQGDIHEHDGERRTEAV